MSLEESLNFRRSVRKYDPEKPIDSEKVKKCIELATLAPNSSNMQLWEFIHVTDPELLKRLSVACFNQSAATTAKEMVVFVTRQDLYRKRAKANLNFEYGNIRKYSPPERQEKRIKNRELYYGKVMPLLYARFFGVIGFFRKLVTSAAGFFRPTMYQASESDMRVVVHKTCALAAQTFMIAMAEQGYDTCPMEGLDSHRVKKILNLPSGAGINMIVSCGIRKGNEGIWGERFRVPFEEVYTRI